MQLNFNVTICNSLYLFLYFQVLIVGDSLLRGMEFPCESRCFPGLTLNVLHSMIACGFLPELSTKSTFIFHVGTNDLSHCQTELSAYNLNMLVSLIARSLECKYPNLKRIYWSKPVVRTDCYAENQCSVGKDKTRSIRAVCAGLCRSVSNSDLLSDGLHLNSSGRLKLQHFLAKKTSVRIKNAVFLPVTVDTNYRNKWVVRQIRSNSPDILVRPLSNMCHCELIIDSQTYESSEHYYQYTKAVKNSYFDKARQILKTESPFRAKNLVRDISTSSEWKYEKVEVMFKALEAKFSQESFKKLLKSTDGQVLIEAFDSFWGSGVSFRYGNNAKSWRGLNFLGNLLMTIRCKIMCEM